MLRNIGLTILVMSLATLAFAQVISNEPEAIPTQLGDNPTRVVVIPIEGEINGITAWALKQRMERAKSEGVDVVVIRLDTPGGLLMPALQISEIIKSAQNIRTVAYVDKNAYSAGALIALACNEIIIRDRGRIGDCAPIIMQGELKGTEREKAESPVRTEFRDSAARNGYDKLLAQSMVSMDISVYQIENIKTGKIRYVNKRDVRLLSDYDPRVEELGQVLSTEGKKPQGKQWKYLKTVVNSKQLLTMTETEAKEYGFVKAIVKSEQEAQAYLGVSNWEVWKYDWGEQAIAFLNSMAVTGLLMAVGLLALYVALNAPGFGVPEVVAIVCFATIFGSKHMAGIAEWWTIALFVIGVLLLMVELLVLPGFGVAGIAGAICVMVGLLGMIMPSDPGKFPFPRTPVAWEMFWGYLRWLIGGFFAFIIGVILLAKYLPRIPKVGRLVLAEAPAAMGEDASHLPDLAPGVDVGQTGVALGPLHPAGQVRIGQVSVDVVTEGELIDAGSEIEVVRREGNRIVVRSKV